MAKVTINLSDTVSALVTKTNTLSTNVGDMDAATVSGADVVSKLNNFNTRFTGSDVISYDAANNRYTISDNSLTYEKLNTVGSPGNGEILTFSTTGGGRLEWSAPADTGSQIVNVATSLPDISGGTFGSDSATLTIPAGVGVWELEIYDDSVTSVIGANASQVVNAVEHDLQIGNWKFDDSAGSLVFEYSGSAKASLDSVGNFSTDGTIQLGNWKLDLDETGTLIFKYNGTAKASLDSTGTFTTIDDIIAFGSI